MYVTINENSLKVNNLTRNADKLLVYFDHNIMLFNYADFLDKVAKGEPNYPAMDETFRDVRIEAKNKVLGIKEFADILETKFGLLPENYKIMSDILWNSNGLDLPVRVVIPQDVVFSNPNYRALVSHVESLAAQNRAYFEIREGLIYLYFVTLLPEHEALLEMDANVLIEYR
jgi:hypothetical protein